MNQQDRITGVVLAGGLARRMKRQDKGLVRYKNRMLVSYAIQAMTDVSDEIVINANRNQEIYRQFGFKVISDSTQTFDGPLAGIYAALSVAKQGVMLVMPCDSPMITAVHLKKLLYCREQEGADIAVAFDGERLHPVFLALKTTLLESLRDYLSRGERKIDRWIIQHRWTQADFSHEADVFLNINTLEDLKALEDGVGE